jgi:hypothetical protein
MEKKYQRSYLRPRLGPTLFHVIGIRPQKEKIKTKKDHRINDGQYY